MAKSFGERIRVRRKAKNLTLDAVAAFVGVTGDVISAWERNLRVPSDRESVEYVINTMPNGADLANINAVGRAYLYITYARHICASECARELSKGRYCGLLTTAVQCLDEASDYIKPRSRLEGEKVANIPAASLLSEMREDDLRALTMYFYDHVNIPQIAKTLGWSRARASRAIKRALGRPELNLRSLKR